MANINNKVTNTLIRSTAPKDLDKRPVITAFETAITDKRDCLIHLKTIADNFLRDICISLTAMGKKSIILSNKAPDSFQNNTLVLELEENLKKEADRLEDNPDVILSRPGRVIDHIRRGNWKSYNPELFIICADPVTETRYIQDIQYIQSKLNKSCQTIILTSKEELFSELHIGVKITPKKNTSISYIKSNDVVDFTRNLSQFIEEHEIKNLVCIGQKPEDILIPGSISFISDVETAPFFTQNILFLHVPEQETLNKAVTLFPEAQFFIVHTSKQKVNRSEESLTMSADKTNFELDEAVIKGFMESVVNKIKTEEDPAEMDQYRKLFKKYSPMFMKGYVGAYMLKYMPKKGFRSSKPANRAPSNPNMVQLFVGLGKNRRIYPKDITGLFCSIENISKPDIGDIKILENYSFVEVAKDKADTIIESLNGTEYRNRRMTVNYAKRKG